MDVLRYLSLLLRRWWVFLLAALVGGALGVAYAQTQPPVYRATTTVFLSVSQAGTAQELVQGSVYTQGVVESYARLATQPIVLDGVRDDLGLEESVRELAGRVTATAELDTTLIAISTTGPDPAATAALADATAARLAVAVRSLSPADAAGGEAVRLTTVGAAAVPAFPVSPDTRLLAMVGAAVALVLAGVGVVVVDLADTRVRRPEDVQQAVGLPVLARIPFDRAPSDSWLVGREERSARAEAYRHLRTNLGFVNVDGRLQSVVVTAGSAGEGKTTTALNLSQVQAAAGLRVLLVDADLRRPSVAGVLGIEGSVGLSTVLVGRVELADAVQEWGGYGLDVLAAGAPPPNPTELLSSEAMGKLVTQLENDYDLVVFDCAPALPVTDPAVVAGVTSGAVLLVVDAQRTTRARLQETVSTLEAAGATLGGVVLNKAAGEPAPYYGVEQDRAPALSTFLDRFRGSSR